MKVLIYDSGIGGRSVFTLVQQYFVNRPEVELQYFADTKNFPYGIKEKGELVQIVLRNMQDFAEQGYEIVGIACNTASSIVEQTNFVDVLGMKVLTIVQPAIDQLLALGKKKVWVIASNFTARSKVFSSQINEKSSDMFLAENGEQTLIDHIEKNEMAAVEQEVKRIVTEMPTDTEVLFLGCTHFSLVKDLFEKELQSQRKNVAIFDPAEILAKLVIEKVEEQLTAT